MAEVHRAYDPSLGREVALKLLHRHLTLDEEVLARFRDEARLAAALRHPHIIEIFEYGETDQRAYMTMAYLPGGTLSDLLKERTRLAPPQAVALLAPIAEALDYAHLSGVVHRDLKPANILLDDHARPVLTDFGIARAFREADLTQAGTLLGTASYMAPEQVEGKSATRQSDIYALGVVLFEALAGRKPFEGDALSVMHQHVHEAPPRLRALQPEVPRALEAVVQRALAKKPEDRFESAGAMAQAMHHALLVPDRPVRFPLITTLAGILAVLLLALVVSIPRILNARSESTTVIAPVTTTVADEEIVRQAEESPTAEEEPTEASVAPPVQPTRTREVSPSPRINRAFPSATNEPTLAVETGMIRAATTRTATPLPTVEPSHTAVLPTQTARPVNTARPTNTSRPSTSTSVPNTPVLPSATPTLAPPTASATARPTGRTVQQAPVPLGPTNGATLSGPTVTLSWRWAETIQSSENFEVWLGFDQWSTPRRMGGTKATQMTVALGDVEPQFANGRWSWYVRVVDNAGTVVSPASAPYQFEVEATPTQATEPQPEPTSPPIDTPVPPPSNTPVLPPTNTPVPPPTNTPVPPPTDTPVPPPPPPPSYPPPGPSYP